MSEEIMIDGVNVSECCFYNNGKCNNPNGMACNCINNTVCYFKELKRLQAENERLKKRQITKNGFICDCEQNVKYRQALEEIKNFLDVPEFYIYGKEVIHNRIENKISEVLK